MGIDINALKFLAAARASGTDFTRTLMVGRQRLYVTPDDVRRVVRGAEPPGGPVADYAEWVFRALGATQVDSLDVSGYEGRRSYTT